MKKFWIVEYVDVNAPKAERSVLCRTKHDAERAVIKRAGFMHFCSVEDFVGRGFCETLRLNGTFDNELFGG